MKAKLKYLIYLIPTIIILLIQFFGVFNFASNNISDAFYQNGNVISPNIYVIGIDSETLSSYGKFETWSRDKVADLVNYLCEDEASSPSVIALDIGYYGTSDEVTDAKLVKAIKEANNCVLVNSVTRSENVSYDASGKLKISNEISVLEEPFDALKEVCLAIGHANIDLDEDGVARHATGTISYLDNKIPSFSEAIVKAYTGKEVKTDSQFYIDYSGKPNDYYNSCSFKDVLEGNYNKQVFAGSIVLIGAYASGMQDNYYTSIDKKSQMYGVEIHANIVNQLLNEKFIKETNSFLGLLITLVSLIIIFILLEFLKDKIAIPCSLALIALYLLISKLLYNLGVLLPLFYPLLGMISLLIIVLVYKYLVSYLEKRKIIATYGKYLSLEVAKKIADSKDKITLGGVAKDIAVLFVDIRGFTSLSEKLSPSEVVTMLNEYFKITTKAIFDHEGTVDKFIGDATMGIFNAPLDIKDYTYKAVLAGLEMVSLASGFIANLDESLKDKVGFGIGINCGEAVVGNIGTDFRMEYTAIGDTVNTASRLEGVASKGTVIISASVYERVKDRIVCLDAGSVKLKGKEKEVKIYQAIKEKTNEEETNN